MKVVKNVLLIILVVLIFIFTIQNRETLSGPFSFRLNLYVIDLSTGTMPLYSIILISFFSGLLLSAVLGWFHRLKLRVQYRTTKSLLDKREQELNSLRNLPVLETQHQSQDEPANPQAQP